jgi:ubiquinone/menaquinone biosynthesis C-methylase UbiE
MSTPEDVRREFALQSGPMARGRTFIAADAVEPFCRLLGDPPPRRVLDLACGPGIVSAAIARAVDAVVAFDLTEEMLEVARARCTAASLGNVEFRLGDAERLPFENGAFDAAVTRLSLHHFRAPHQVLAELRRVVSKGGVLVLGDIVSSEDTASAALHNALEQLRDPSHVRLLSEPDLVALVENAGFEVVAMESWENDKTFSEWAAVVSEARSVEPVREVMRALAHHGIDAGIGLSIKDGEVHFTHHWRFLSARAA